MTQEDIKHLLLRTSLGIQTNQVSHLSKLTRKQALDFILSKVRTDHYTNPPIWFDEKPFNKTKKLSKEDRKKINKIRREQSIDLKAWWFQEMLITPSPFTEQMTLFWHNHFTSSLSKVKLPKLMYLQNRLLRKHAFGNFRDLLHAITEDSAMILYLDNQSNRKGKPNENYARELLELFSLGEGNYTENDVKEAARAFTGYQINRETGEFFINFRQHDFTEKTFLQRTGEFIGEDIVDIILEQPKVAKYISEKIIRKFIFAPSRQLLSDLANNFFNSGYEITPLIQNILNSEEFWSPDNRATMIKSPVELIVGTLRTLGLQPGNYRPLVQGSKRMGQDILDPPNVKGWVGGKQWVTTNTFLARKSVLLKFLKTTRKPHQMMNRMTMTTNDKMHMQIKLPPREHLQKYGLATRPIFEESNQRNMRNFLRNLINEPSYQLK